MLNDKLLKEFGSIEALHLFLREQINDGEQISKGKTDVDDSKEKKKAEAPEKPDPAGDEEDEAGDEEGGFPPPGAGAPEGGAEMGADAEPVVDPVATPGSQVQMGGLTKDDKDDKEIDNPDAVEIEVSGEKEKIDLNPSVDVNTIR